MLELPPVDDSTWWDWLEQRGLDDPSYTLQALHMRYQRFHKVKFGLGSEEEKLQWLKELIPLERGLVYGDAIGRVEEFPFTFAVHDRTPIRQRPIPYARGEREWINQYLEK
jgi:hypothetical protein